MPVIACATGTIHLTFSQYDFKVLGPIPFDHQKFQKHKPRLFVEWKALPV